MSDRAERRRLVIFDMDGTLIDSGALILGAQILTAKRLGLTHPGREAGFAVVGLSLGLALEHLFGTDVPTGRMVEVYKDAFHELRADPAIAEQPFDAIEAAMDAIAAMPGTHLAIATGKTLRGVDQVLDRFGWRHRFGPIQTADNAPSKPDPGMILNALAETGCDPARTVMIGDSVHDMRMARAAGVAALAVTWGFQSSSLLREAGATHVAKTVADLPDAVLEAIGA
jgi:phosphoglycolate phosphatase